MTFFDKLKQKTKNLPFKDTLRPYYLPFLHWLKYKVENKRFLSGGVEVLQKAKIALDESNTFFWLDFGTLLGPTRDGRLIKHDTDIDLAVFLKDHSPLIKKSLEKHGFILQHTILVDDGKYGLEESYLYENIQLDIFYYSRDEKQMWCHLFPFDVNKNRVVKELKMTYSGFSSFSFIDQEWNIPTNYHQRLVDTYGENYKIPDPNWYTPDDALNAQILNKKITYA